MASKKMEAVESVDTVKAEPKPVFSKEQILKSAKYANRKDILTVLIKDGENITLDEVEVRMSNFMKGKVN